MHASVTLMHQLRSVSLPPVCHITTRGKPCVTSKTCSRERAWQKTLRLRRVAGRRTSWHKKRSDLQCKEADARLLLSKQIWATFNVWLHVQKKKKAKDLKKTECPENKCIWKSARVKNTQPGNYCPWDREDPERSEHVATWLSINIRHFTTIYDRLMFFLHCRRVNWRK